MKRTPLKPRKKSLARGKPPKRTPLKRSARALIRKTLLKRGKPPRATGKPRFKTGKNPAYLTWIRGLPCLLTARKRHTVWPPEGPFDGTFHVCGGAIEVAHVKSRGASGPDYGNCVPLCAGSHLSQHTIGIKTWSKRWFPGGLDELRRIAAEVYPQQYERAKALGWPE